MKRKKR